ALVERDRAPRVGAALHIDPERPAGLRRALRQASGMRQGAVAVEVVAELRKLDAHLAVERSLPDVVEQPEVMLDDGLALFARGDVLAEAGELAGDALGLESRGRLERALGVLAGHEPPDRPPREPQAWDVIAQPAVPGHPEQQPTHHAQPTAAALAILDRSQAIRAPRPARCARATCRR